MDKENYPVISDRPLARHAKAVAEIPKEFPVAVLLKTAISRKMDADLIFYYKKNQKSVYNYFIVFFLKERF